MGRKQANTPIQQPRTGTGLKKGYSLINLKDFVAERFGPQAWGGFVATLPCKDRGSIGSVVRDRWYPLSLHARVNRAFCDHFREGSLSIAQELGCFSAEQDIATIHRWFLRLFRPSTLLRNVNHYWRRGDDTGEWSSVLKEDEIFLRLSDWGVVEPAMCQRLLGYFGHLLKLRGPVEMLRHSQCRDRGDPYCEFHFRWQLQTDAPQAGLLSSVEDVMLVERELSHCSDIEALEDSIVHVLRSQLRCPLAHLWVEPAGGGQVVLVRSAGEAARGELQVFPIETRGRVIGWLEVELPAGPEEGLAVELLDRLASSFGRLLHAARTSQLGLSQRLHAAETRCHLTKREAEVLQLIVLGKSYKEVAAELGCSEETVVTHVTRLRTKCSPDGRPLSRAELVAWFWSTL